MESSLAERSEQVPAQALRRLVQIGIALTAEPDLAVLLERIVGEARWFTKAEAGSLLMRDGDVLRFAVVQNQALATRWGEAEMRRRVQAEPLRLSRPTLAGYVAMTGQAILLPDAYQVSGGSPYRFDPWLDTITDYRTRSVLIVPLPDKDGEILGVLELLNALDGGGAVVPFGAEVESPVRALASQASLAVRAARLEDLSLRDTLTGVYNRRYFALRVEEEGKRHARFAEPVSVVLLDLDRFKGVNDRLGHGAGDEALREVAQLLLSHSRGFTIVTRFGGDEFAILLVNTPKSGAVSYAQRIKDLIEHHPFRHGPLTASLGVASLPEDVQAAADLIPAADRALYLAKRLGRNCVQTV